MGGSGGLSLGAGFGTGRGGFGPENRRGGGGGFYGGNFNFKGGFGRTMFKVRKTPQQLREEKLIFERKPGELWGPIRCNANHECLRLWQRPQAYYSDPSCDTCGKSIKCDQSFGIFHCKVCSWDLCPECALTRTRRCIPVDASILPLVNQSSLVEASRKMARRWDKVKKQFKVLESWDELDKKKLPDPEKSAFGFNG